MSKLFTITEGLENLGAIKTGGQGSVYKGSRVGAITTAVKLLPTPIFSQNESDKHYRDFINEVKKLERVNAEPNPNIVKILSYGVTETGSFPFIEMEFIEGPDLAELLRPPHDPIFTIKEAVKVAEQLANALAHCHKADVKHGDIKSNNVKYNTHTGNYVLLDFGLAALSNEERRTSLQRAGAVEFMAPEQNEGELLFETDVYSFGVVLFELLAGRVPFPLDRNSETARNKVMLAHMEDEPPNLTSLRAAAMPSSWPGDRKEHESNIPQWLTALVQKCLQKDPANRFANGQALYQQILVSANYRPAAAKPGATAESIPAESSKTKIVTNEAGPSADRPQQAAVQVMPESRRGRATQPPKKSVSKSAFNAVLVALMVVVALAVYGMFFYRPQNRVAGQDREAASVTDSSTSDRGSEVAQEPAKNTKTLPASPTAKKPIDDPAPDTPKETTEPAKPAASAPRKKEPERDVASSTGQTENPDGGRNNGSGSSGDLNVRYKVRGTAYFHNTPDEATRRNAFINHWNNAVLEPLDDKNGFIYIVYTNDKGQTSKGWLSKKDLIPIK